MKIEVYETLNLQIVEIRRISGKGIFEFSDPRDLQDSQISDLNFRISEIWQP